jgi:hypothetical protein
MDVQSRIKFKAPKVYGPTTEQFTAPKLLSDFLSLQEVFLDIEFSMLNLEQRQTDQWY